MAKLSFNMKRVLCGLALAQMLFFVANYYVFHLLEPFDKKALIVSGAILGVCVLYFGPSIDELRDYRERKRGSAQ